ncbi:hypothetical protein, partial [Conservatibacter flavescens]
MKALKFLGMSIILPLFFSTLSVAEVTKTDNLQSDYIKIVKMTAKQAYQFTRQDVEVVKKLIYSSLAILEQKSTIYRELAKLGKPFEGGEHVPKKWFEPITSGDIAIRYIFREATTEQPEIAGMYGSYLRKHLRQKRWDYASIRIFVDDYGQATDFLDSDFEEFDLVFKEKI